MTVTYYGRRGYSRAPRRDPLTPAPELVGRFVSWRPKTADGKRLAPVYGTVTAHDADAGTLTVQVSKEQSPWSPEPYRMVTVKLSSGPFRVVS